MTNQMWEDDCHRIVAHFNANSIIQWPVDLLLSKTLSLDPGTLVRLSLFQWFLYCILCLIFSTFFLFIVASVCVVKLENIKPSNVYEPFNVMTTPLTDSIKLHCHLIAFLLNILQLLYISITFNLWLFITIIFAIYLSKNIVGYYHYKSKRFIIINVDVICEIW